MINFKVSKKPGAGIIFILTYRSGCYRPSAVISVMKFIALFQTVA